MTESRRRSYLLTIIAGVVIGSLYVHSENYISLHSSLKEIKSNQEVRSSYDNSDIYTEIKKLSIKLESIERQLDRLSLDSLENKLDKTAPENAEAENPEYK